MGLKKLLQSFRLMARVPNLQQRAN